MSTHLKPDQLSDVLLGIAERETTAHLDGCPQCRTEIETMRATLGSFRAAAVNWSEGAARQVAFPEKPLAAKPSAFPRWTRPAWVLTACALIFAVTISFPLWRRQSNRPSATVDAQAQITRDNQLLAHIESEVGEITPEPMQPLQVNSEGRTR